MEPTYAEAFVCGYYEASHGITFM